MWTTRQNCFKIRGPENDHDFPTATNHFQEIFLGSLILRHIHVQALKFEVAASLAGPRRRLSKCLGPFGGELPKDMEWIEHK